MSACITICLLAGLATCRSQSSDPRVQGSRRVLLDCYYNNEWKPGPTGGLVRYHYIWSDTANSGFSILSRIIGGVGGVTDTLAESPTPEALSRAHVYLIVDPDTPKESPGPHYIEEPAVGTIVAWVNGGGILVLLGNDKGNAEFDHLNTLAARFGIHFNEDSRNRVTGQKFETGTFDKLPGHPLFRGVGKIFIKENCTLRVREPARALLTEGGDVIMAFARVGKGAVFAVGDPWFYNEYMDARRLPDGYDNGRAAENLFRWLLTGFQE